VKDRRAPATLPADLGLVLDAGLRRLDGGRVLLGGSPLRFLRLSEAGAAALQRLADGATVGRGRGLQALARRLLDAGMAHPRPGSTPWTGDDVTAVVPVRDDLAGALSTCAALAGEVAAVVAVDDGSHVPLVVPDGRVTMLRRQRSGGPGAARNTGLAIVDTPLVAFVDADATPTEGWLQPLLTQLADPEVAAVAPRVASAPGPGPLAAYETIESPLDLGQHESRVAPRCPVPYVPTAALLARTDVMREMGGFDESLRYGEDVDLVWRLVASASATVRYEPAALVFHAPRPDLGTWAAQRFHYGASAAPLVARHPGAAPPLAVSAWSLAAWALLALRLPVAGAGVAAVSTALLVRKLRGMPRPAGLALRLAGMGHLAAGRWIAKAASRAWWPVTLPAALLSRRLRPALLAAFLLPPLWDWWRKRPPLDPGRYLLLRLGDDLAYGAGLWVGCWRQPSARALVPDLTSWPGRSRREE
jgi:mycofactocin glycosyltransferase